MDDHVIFNANTAERLERFNFLPVEVLAERAFAPWALTAIR
ncbi:hypothetical protein LTSEUGA_5442 [Salmonella enterica subsp. enterica serovar Uganda str. R8-3404]|uniref:Uncharacterized protein n=1 Tax=Salmonella enterica subsp. enterica serovar Uganda str. R8-3404 TaxID=913083 RepID=A0A6C8GVA9_SALET|nr:hypothetical protein LTSEUGA_5442 [Salmonella enterica subsp. enterica serovar Uganda str. R8-3404]